MIGATGKFSKLKLAPFFGIFNLGRVHVIELSNTMLNLSFSAIIATIIVDLSQLRLSG